MDGQLVRLELVLGVPLCLAGALTAFLITYDGYMKATPPDRRLAFRMGLRMGVGALAALAVVLGIIVLAVSSIRLQ